MGRIEEMNASRPEDKDAILAKITDRAAYNQHVQRMLFDDLLPSWRHLDVSKQLDRAGHILRWKSVACQRGTLTVLRAGAAELRCRKDNFIFVLGRARDGEMEGMTGISYEALSHD